MSKTIVIFITTTSRDEAKKIGQLLVEESLVACWPFEFGGGASLAYTALTGKFPAKREFTGKYGVTQPHSGGPYRVIS